MSRYWIERVYRHCPIHLKKKKPYKSVSSQHLSCSQGWITCLQKRKRIIIFTLNTFLKLLAIPEHDFPKKGKASRNKSMADMEWVRARQVYCVIIYIHLLLHISTSTTMTHLHHKMNAYIHIRLFKVREWLVTIELNILPFEIIVYE